jgi:hypothetical protein
MGLPLVKFGGNYVSKLILGGNPISGFSHISALKDKEMEDYYTSSNIKSAFDECLKNGINTIQTRGDRHIMRILNEYQNEGKNIKWIAQTASEIKDLKANLHQITSMRAIAVYLHGTYADNLWHTGPAGITQVQDELKRIRDTGLHTGLGTHRPEVIDYVESNSWDIDFYMTSLYNLAKTPKSVQATSGFKEEVFDNNDADPMFKMIKQTSKQCLVFKVLGAGRKTQSPEKIVSAFDHAFSNIKKEDCVVVGMFQKYSNQVAQNARIIEDILMLK